MTGKKYPEEIYPRPSDYNGQKIMSITPKDLELAYDWGYRKGRLAGGAEHLDPGALWTRLTSSHPDWDRIDWVALYGRPAILSHSISLSSISTIISSKGPYTVGYDDGDRNVPADQALLLKALPGMVHSALNGATQAALEGKDGWALYVHGDLPLRKLTADQLKPGTCFKGKWMGEVRDCLLYQEAPAYYEVGGEEVGPVYELKAVGVNIYPEESRVGASTSPVCWLASQVEVLKVYSLGTFEMPEGDA